MLELTEPKSRRACWVGSVSIDDEVKFSEFMARAKQGDITSLIQYQQIGGDLAYAVLLNLTENQWKLVVIKSLADPFSKEEPLFSAILSPKVQIEVYDRKETPEEHRLMESCGLRFRDILREWINFWKK